MNITKAGIYTNVSNEDYHASDGISNSQMKYLLPPYCPKMFFYHNLSGKKERKSTDSFDIGSAVHTLVFEPQLFAKLFYPVIEIPKRNTNLGKSAYESMQNKAAGRTILEQSDMDIINEMAANVKSHAMWQSVKGDKTGCIEHSLAWLDPDYEVLLRSRPDFYTDDVIIDLKTTKDSTPGAFQKSVSEYGYHRQGALAIDGLTTLTGREYKNVILFVVDKNPPHLVRCYVMADRAIEQGRYEYKYAARAYERCQKTGVWDSFPEIIEDLDLPAWAYKAYENDSVTSGSV